MPEPFLRRGKVWSEDAPKRPLLYAKPASCLVEREGTVPRAVEWRLCEMVGEYAA
jgi:hypothetical protein